MRTIIDVPPGQLDELDRLCKREGISRAEAIRQAIGEHLRKYPSPDRDAAFGIWRGRDLDGLVYQHAIRREWDR